MVHNDRRQWNYVGIGVYFRDKIFRMRTNLGIIHSPFGPTQKYTDYKYIMENNIKFFKDLKGVKTLLEIDLYTTLGSSIRTSVNIRAGIVKDFFNIGVFYKKEYDKEGILGRYYRGKGFLAEVFKEEFYLKGVYSYIIKNKRFDFYSFVVTGKYFSKNLIIEV